MDMKKKEVAPPPYARPIVWVLQKAGVTINGPNPWDPHVYDARIWRRILLQGSLGLGEGYIAGEWAVEDLEEFLYRLIMSPATNVLQIPETLAMLWRHYGPNKQTISGAQKVIDEHYNLPLEYFQAMLCERLVYTSGLWCRESESLAEAQLNKIDSVLDFAMPQPGDVGLDIGGGFGALCNRAIEARGVKGMTLVTRSSVQGEYAISNGPLSGLTVRNEDYREMSGPYGPGTRYDFVTSVEMIEAVGKKNLKDFFTHVHRVLKQGNKFVLQAIVSRVPLGLSNAFLDKYIFPNGYLPTEKELKKCWDPHFILCSTQVKCFGSSYVKTLRSWRANLLGNKHLLHTTYGTGEQLERFIRTHEFYLLMCAAAFRAQRIDVVQYPLLHRDYRTWKYSF